MMTLISSHDLVLLMLVSMEGALSLGFIWSSVCDTLHDIFRRFITEINKSRLQFKWSLVKRHCKRQAGYSATISSLQSVTHKAIISIQHAVVNLTKFEPKVHA